jgi:geranylgeranyl diphosphate synthase type II
MSVSDIASLLERDRDAVEARCTELLDRYAGEHARMREAMGYSLLGGGKRLRPVLCLWTADLAGGGNRAVALDAACAIECVHTYSLVHDDLPCMDDDDMRRGRPSSHRRFGEATAVLTGDALLTLAFQILSDIAPGREEPEAGAALEAVRVLARAAGTGGLITGQALDLEPDLRGGLDEVTRIHENKTARLISASMEIGAVTAGAGTDFRAGVREAGRLAGLAFQIVDDLLDLEMDEETLGKTPGKDVKTGKLTWPAVAGAGEARAEAGRLLEASLDALPPGGKQGALGALLRRLVERRA